MKTLKCGQAPEKNPVQLLISYKEMKKVPGVYKCTNPYAANARFVVVETTAGDHVVLYYTLDNQLYALNGSEGWDNKSYLYEKLDLQVVFDLK